VPSTKSALFVVRKNVWNTKEGTGKSMKNPLRVQWMAKGTSQAKVTLNSEKIKSVALGQLHLSEGISQAISHQAVN